MREIIVKEENRQRIEAELDETGAELGVTKMEIIESMDYFTMRGDSHMERLFIYENPCCVNPTWIYEGTPRELYYMSMSLSRMYHHRDGEVPYMKCTDDKVDLLIISKRNYLNLGWHEVI